ncbi:ubiquitin carboxyl-terminal hydrolase [Mariannaea sp. PMI_226]|nr:ubiquitin carboxyl-terminal hydrolase [Mariannaea sp. PMI_226]
MAGTDPQAPSNPRRVFTMLENNPEVMNELGAKMGLSPDLEFYDVFSLDDPDLLAMVPSPVHALLVIIPMTPAWGADVRAEDNKMEWYQEAGPEEPVLWFKQTITHGCGLIGFIHCALNGVPSESIVQGSVLAKLRDEATPLHMDDRARLLSESQTIYDISQSVAVKGDTAAPTLAEMELIKGHFVAFVKGKDGNLWELEGGRKGPLCRGPLGPDEHVLSKRALDLGLKRVIGLQGDAGGDTRFSCIALATRQT